VNAIWEGSGNVMCLDVLRAFGRDGEPARAVLSQIARSAEDIPEARQAAEALGKMLAAGGEADARAAVERLALLAAAAALKAGAPAAVADMHGRARLAAGGGHMWGTAALTDSERGHLLERALPVTG
jgi:putative acyl-CoA dehydrogenase